MNPAAAGTRPGISRPGLLFAAVGLTGLALPFAQFRANRIVGGEGLSLPDALGPWGWAAAALVVAVLLALSRVPPRAALGAAACGLLAVTLSAGAAAGALVPEGDRIARVSLGAGFWLLLAAFALALADALSRLALRPAWRWALLAGTVAAIALILGTGLLDDLSVMREYAVRRDMFWREAQRHLALAFGSLGAALAVGLPLGILIHEAPRLRGAVLGVLNVVQTIPSLALFGIMIPLFGWIAAGIAGIGAFPALVALFLYSLLPVVSNMLAGLAGVPPGVREAAAGLGMTRAQALAQVMIPLTLPVLLAAVRIVLVQNIGLAVIAGLIGGGGFGSFVFQGLNQTAMDLVLLGALPTIALALVSGIALDLALDGLDPRKGHA